MSLATINFNGLVEGSSASGSKDSESIARIFFDLIIHGRPQYNLYCDVVAKDSSSSPAGDIQVAEIVGYTGALNESAFSSAVARYLRRHAKRKSYTAGNGDSVGSDTRVHIVMYSSSESFEIDQH